MSDMLASLTLCVPMPLTSDAWFTPSGASSPDTLMVPVPRFDHPTSDEWFAAKPLVRVGSMSSPRELARAWPAGHEANEVAVSYTADVEREMVRRSPFEPSTRPEA